MTLAKIRPFKLLVNLNNWNMARNLVADTENMKYQKYGAPPRSSCELTALLIPIGSQRTLLLYVDALGAGLFGLGRIHSLLYVRSKAVESILDVDIVLSRYLQKRNAELISELLTLFCRHNPFFFPVALVPDKYLMHTLTCMLFNVVEPGSNICILLKINTPQKIRQRSSYSEKNARQ